MPQVEPHRAWATFQFTGASGRVNECDLLIAVPGGLCLLELKGHPGRVVNHGDTWQFHEKRVRTLKNPLHLTDLKAKELKEQLTRAARALNEDPRLVPFIKPAVFLHDADLVSDLDEFQRTAVYGRNDGVSGLPGIWDGLLGLPPERESWRITPRTGLLLEKLMKHIGVSHFLGRRGRSVPRCRVQDIALGQRLRSGSGERDLAGVNGVQLLDLLAVPLNGGQQEPWRGRARADYGTRVLEHHAQPCRPLNAADHAHGHVVRRVGNARRHGLDGFDAQGCFLRHVIQHVGVPPRRSARSVRG
ncbi:NERD domain-containing protein [Streptomyces sp. NPDC018000]|uniref:nuclease-related domain-containing protein n=1 Tax=Streptomyces sp. NPDC018000 TaxID=3365028 RepID=UPI0037A1AB5F